MDDILRQIVDLFVGSLPTMPIFLLLVFFYTVLVHGPLKRTLAERRARTAGAVEKAHAAISVAEAKTQEYEARLRAARLEIQQGRERQLAGWNAAREKAASEARAAAAAQLRTARAALEADAERSRAAMSGQIDELATQILATILPPAARDHAGFTEAPAAVDEAPAAVHEAPAAVHEGAHS